MDKETEYKMLKMFFCLVEAQKIIPTLIAQYEQILGPVNKDLINKALFNPELMVPEESEVDANSAFADILSPQGNQDLMDDFKTPKSKKKGKLQTIREIKPRPD